MFLAPLLSSLISAAPPIPEAPKWRAPTPVSSKTEGGMVVAVLPQRGLPLVHLVIAAEAGSDRDPPEHLGIASAVAAMLEEGGAGKRSGAEVIAALDDLGAELRIECGEDGAMFALTVLEPKLPAALSILADLLMRPRFDGAAWSTTRQRLIAQILHDRDDPAQIAKTVFSRVLFGAHPYGHPPLGTPASLEALRPDDLKAFHAAHYGPRTTSLMMVGQIEPARATQLVAEAFRGWHADVAPPPAPPVAPRSPPKLVLVDRPGAPQTELRVGYVGFARDTPDYPALMVLQTVLGGTFTSRLNQNLREKHGYTYGVTARFDLFRAPGRFVIGTAVKTEVTVEALKEIFDELSSIRSGLSEEEIKKGKAMAASAIVEALSEGSQAALLYADLMIDRVPLDFYSRLPDAMDKLTPAGITQVAERAFLPDQAWVVMVGDKKTLEPKLKALPLAKNGIELLNADGDPAKP
jgi:zinc protease